MNENKHAIDFYDITPRYDVEFYGDGGNVDMEAPDIDGAYGMLNAAESDLLPSGVLLDAVRIGDEDDPKHNQGRGSFLVAGFALKLLADGHTSFEMTTENPAMVHVANKLFGPENVQYFDRNDPELELPMDEQQAIDTVNYVREHDLKDRSASSDYRDLGNPMFVTRVNLDSLTDAEYQGLVDIYSRPE